MEGIFCNNCLIQKDISYYVRSKTVCKDCNNADRRQKYKENPEYHNKHNIILPQEYYHLFAKHLDAGSPLEPLLPLTTENSCEELG